MAASFGYISQGIYTAPSKDAVPAVLSFVSTSVIKPLLQSLEISDNIDSADLIVDRVVLLHPDETVELEPDDLDNIQQRYGSSPEEITVKIRATYKGVAFERTFKPSLNLI